MIADTLRKGGFDVALRSAGDVQEVGDYEAVIVGGALYASRWHRDARRFVKHHVDQLRARPTWLFSSGPLDDSVTTKFIPPVKGVRALMKRIDARGHVTFGGRLAPDATGFPARAMAKKMAGDWRDPAAVREWTASVADELTHPTKHAEGAAAP
jgi:menaquinone-dependent protoporphyrinogen oxidase